MRVIYKPYMIRKIMQARSEAAMMDREIEKIKLTPAEWDQLKEESCQNMGPEEWYRRFCDNNRTVPMIVEVAGIKVEKEA